MSKQTFWGILAGLVFLTLAVSLWQQSHHQGERAVLIERAAVSEARADSALAVADAEQIRRVVLEDALAQAHEARAAADNRAAAASSEARRVAVIASDVLVRYERIRNTDAPPETRLAACDLALTACGEAREAAEAEVAALAHALDTADGEIDALDEINASQSQELASVRLAARGYQLGLDDERLARQMTEAALVSTERDLRTVRFHRAALGATTAAALGALLYTLLGR